MSAARPTEPRADLEELLDRLQQGYERQLDALRSGSGDTRGLAALEGVLHALDERLRSIRGESAGGRREEIEKLFTALGVVSHKINNPLTALMGRAQILQLKQGSDPQIAKAASVIEESAQRVANYVRELSRIVHEARERLLADSGTAPP